MNANPTIPVLAWVLLLATAPLATGGPVSSSPPDLSEQPRINHPPVNHPPSAQAGPPVAVVDGGPRDADNEENGQADIIFEGDRTSDPDNRRLVNEASCATLGTPGERSLDFEWYAGEDANTSAQDPVVTGEFATLVHSKPGWHNLTLEVEDLCGGTDVDHVHGFVARERTLLADHDLDATVPTDWTTTGVAHTTDACNVNGDGSYLAFNRGLNASGECHYESTDPVQGTATFTFDPGDADVLAMHFDTRFDVRDGIGTLEEQVFGNVVEDLMTVQASLDGGNTWTKPNHTFQFQRADDDLEHSWKRAGGLYDLSDRSTTDPPIEFRFAFDSVTAVDGGGYGWLVDDIRFTELIE